ncbi:MAG: UbiX family flavin prenyltransferase [Acidimicrobiia bacterium]|nr:UbiX family flavin prenyltransferase [Acidimicrobiia bacterium]
MTPDQLPQRLVVGISGSSAPQYGIALLEALRELPGIESHLILSQSAHRTIELETNLVAAEVEALADVVYAPDDFAASVSSGSFITAGMAIVPCSMGTLGAIAQGLTPSLLARAAGVMLKERRRLVLVPRETPLSLIHLRNMVAVTEAGATVLPPVPAFYTAPRSVEDLVAHTVGKILDQFAISHDLFQRWTTPRGE